MGASGGGRGWGPWVGGALLIGIGGAAEAAPARIGRGLWADCSAQPTPLGVVLRCPGVECASEAFVDAVGVPDAELLFDVTGRRFEADRAPQRPDGAFQEPGGQLLRVQREPGAGGRGRVVGCGPVGGAEGGAEGPDDAGARAAALFQALSEGGLPELRDGGAPRPRFVGERLTVPTGCIVTAPTPGDRSVRCGLDLLNLREDLELPPVDPRAQMLQGYRDQLEPLGLRSSTTEVSCTVFGRKGLCMHVQNLNTSGRDTTAVLGALVSDAEGSVYAQCSWVGERDRPPAFCAEVIATSPLVAAPPPYPTLPQKVQLRRILQEKFVPGDTRFLLAIRQGEDPLLAVLAMGMLYQRDPDAYRAEFTALFCPAGPAPTEGLSPVALQREYAEAVSRLPEADRTDPALSLAAAWQHFRDQGLWAASAEGPIPAVQVLVDGLRGAAPRPDLGPAAMGACGAR